MLKCEEKYCVQDVCSLQISIYLISIMNRLGVYNALKEKLKCDIGSVLIMMYKGKNFRMSNKSSLPQFFLFLDSQIKII